MVHDFAFLDTFRMVFDILLIFHIFLNKVYYQNNNSLFNYLMVSAKMKNSHIIN